MSSKLMTHLIFINNLEELDIWKLLSTFYRSDVICLIIVYYEVRRIIDVATIQPQQNLLLWTTNETFSFRVEISDLKEKNRLYSWLSSLRRRSLHPAAVHPLSSVINRLIMSHNRCNRSGLHLKRRLFQTGSFSSLSAGSIAKVYS